MDKRVDQFYIEEDHYSQPKEYFREALNKIKKNSSVDKKNEFLDIGCAAGDFIKYCAGEFPDWSFTGLDVYDDNLAEAKRRFEPGTFINFNINSSTENLAKKFDLITMFGTHSIFNELYWIENFANCLKLGGFGLIFGMFNPYPYDVFVSLREFGSSRYEQGWNSWCFQTIENEFGKFSCDLDIEYWNLPIEMPARSEDPIRSWTLKLDDGKNLVTNASRMIHDFAFITVRK